MQDRSATGLLDSTQLLVMLVNDKYAPQDERDRAMKTLAARSIVWIELQKEARDYLQVVRFQRWKDQCNLIVSQIERQHSNEWINLKLQHEIDAPLEHWMVGKPIGTVENGMLTVVLQGQTIPVMQQEYAELMRFRSFDAYFRLQYQPKTNQMVISALKRRPYAQPRH